MCTNQECVLTRVLLSKVYCRVVLSDVGHISTCIHCASNVCTQFQVKLAEQQPQSKPQKSGPQQINDIDEAISNLQLTLGQKEEGAKNVRCC